MEKFQLIGKYLIALALIYFSTVLLLLVHEAAQTRKAIPQLIEKLDSIENSENIIKVLSLAAQITGDTAKISGEVSDLRKGLPALYAEVEKTRALIPGILKESEAIRHDLPELYAQVEKTRALIPGIIKEVETVRRELPLFYSEVEKTGLLVSQALEEIKAVRKEAPQFIADTEKLIREAKKAGDEAGKGAVHGVVKGVITAPLDVIESGISGVKEKVTGKEETEKK